MTFEPGQRVECIDADGAPQLRLKGVYTVKDTIGPCKQLWRGTVVYEQSVHLHEAEPHQPYTAFAAQRFRPIQERPTDISVFKEMLIDIPVEA